MATGISQLDLALKVGAEPNQERSWEYGQKQPTEHDLQMLAAGLGITVQDLTGKDESQGT
jgi:transcriptional regulator with XRE-family HTH domain